MSALSEEPFGPGWHPVAAAVVDVGARLAEVIEVPLWSLNDRQLPDLLTAAGTALARLQGLLVRLVGEIDSRDLAGAVGASSTAALARHGLAMTSAAAAELTAVARATRRDMVGTGQALAAGRVSYPQAAAIVRAVQALPAEAGPDVRGRAEAHLIGEAGPVRRRGVDPAGPAHPGGRRPGAAGADRG